MILQERDQFKKLQRVGVPPTLPTHADASASPSQRFNKEKDVWQQPDSPFVAPLLATVSGHGFKFISPWYGNGHILEFVPKKSPSYDHRLQLVSTLPDSLGSVVCAYILGRKIKDLTAGLRHLHDIGIWHGDLKAVRYVCGSDPCHDPLTCLFKSNAMVTDEGRAVLIDFGLGEDSDAAVGTEKGMSSHHSGNELYSPPELLVYEGGKPKPGRTGATDIYSFACLLLEVRRSSSQSHPNLTQSPMVTW